MQNQDIAVGSLNGNARPARIRIPLALLAGLACLTLCNCSLIVDSDHVQCSKKEDCTQRAGAFAGSECVDNFCRTPLPWSCLGQVVWPSASTSAVTVTMNLVYLVGSQPVSGLTAQACRKLDTTCSSPLLRDLVSDGSGKMTFSVPSGFDGYLQSTSDGIMPFLYFFYPPVTENREVPAVPILQATELANFATMVGGNIMPDRGHVLARGYNCLAKTAEGIHFTSPEGDGSTTPFYMIKGWPSTKQSETDSSGNGGLLNLPVGSVTITGRLEDGQTTGTLGLMTWPGRMSYTAMVPAPR
jgi:hypothetical protein